MQNVSSDAKLFGEDIYLMYMDFSSAFNTIDHDKLLIIMFDLGSPLDCIEAVKNLFEDMETTLVLPGDENRPVIIEHGTIPGDSLPVRSHRTTRELALLARERIPSRMRQHPNRASAAAKSPKIYTHKLAKPFQRPASFSQTGPV